MRRKKQCALVCTAAIMASAMTMSMNAMAQSDYDMIAVPYEQDAAWDEIVMANDDVVSTGVYIRAAASANSQVVGSLYKGQAAWIVDQGEEWTEIYSGGLTGFVKNEYLVYGEEAKAVAESHGLEGVATTWDDVKVYAGEDGASEVLESLDYGDSMILTQDNGHWLQVQSGADSVAYVSSEDVSRVLLLDTAVAKEDVYQAPEVSYEESSYEENWSDDTSYEESWTDDSYTDDFYSESWTDDSYTDDSYSESWTDDSYSETYVDTSYSETYTDDSYSETYTDTSYSDTYTDSSADYYETESVSAETYDSSASSAAAESYYDPETGIYFDASTGLYYDSGTGILYDAYWNPVNSETATPMTEAVQETEAYVEQTEAYVEQTEASSTTTSASSDDTTLLAAIIYCEAGNQSYEGKVAVGAVVMNRVYSASFPNTISEVIYQSGQFTPASSGALASALANGVPSSCYDAAVAALNGENPVGSALYFNTGSGKGVKIGDHQFY
jgi:hypothetical protein